MGMALVTVPRYTVDDLERFPEDGNRYELLDGVLLVTPAPRAAHQIVVSRIRYRLTEAVASSAHVVGPGAISVPPRKWHVPGTGMAVHIPLAEVFQGVA